MIAYRASDVKLSWEHNHPVGEMGAPKTCGYVKEPFEVDGSTEIDDDNDEDYDDDNDEIIDNGELVLESTEGEEESIWSKNANKVEPYNAKDKSIQQTKNRVKRQSDQYEYTPTKTRCPLLLVADYRFFQEMGGGNTKTTINYLVKIYTEQQTFFFFIFSLNFRLV